MSDEVIRQITEEERENNPKAVFLGEYPEIINPLASLLSDTRVDLFAGKSLSDALFGDYFFYVGSVSGVKDFVVATGNKLPRSLLLLNDVTDRVWLSEWLLPYSHIKAVVLGSEPFLDERQARKIVDFFLGGNKQILAMIKETSRPMVRQIDPADVTERPEDGDDGRTEKREETVQDFDKILLYNYRIPSQLPFCYHLAYQRI